jgi:hypothetical protein
MSGDQEHDAPRQHPTECELFGEWWTHDFWGREDVVENPSPEKDEYFAALSAWQAGRAPLLKRIEELGNKLNKLNYFKSTEI